MKWNLLPVRAFLVAGIVGGGAAESRAVDAEPNDTLSTAQAVVGNASGETLVSGEFRLLDIDLNDAVTSLHTLVQGQVNEHNFTGLAAGAPALVILNNDLGFAIPDTMLRALDEFGNEVAFDDDGSFVGSGTASALTTPVNADGSLHLEVTGYGDFDFDGSDDFAGLPHFEFGAYTLSYLVGPFGDVDFYRITGLQPGTKWAAETLAAVGEDPLDTIMTFYDAQGQLVDQNDDIDFDADNYLSSLVGDVPASGEIILAVTAFPDLDNIGGHFTIGNYRLAVTYEVVPEPHALALALVGACAAPWRRVRRVALLNS